MKKLLAALILLLIFSCLEKSNEKTSDKETETLNTKSDNIDVKEKTSFEKIASESVFTDSMNFKFYSLKKFNLNNWYAGKIVQELKPLTNKKLREYFQDNRVKDDHIYSANFRYFSIQKNTNSEKIITILESDETCCSNLHFLVYNNRNELISDNIVAGTGGDGMWSYDQSGEFLNDSTFVQTRIDLEEMDLDDNGSEIHIDSVITHFRFFKNKQFEKLTELKFKKVEKNKQHGIRK